MTDNRQADYATLLKRSLVAIDELEARLAVAQRANTEPVAIIGMSCRFPGGADSPEAFWDLLSRGVDAVTEVPSERWEVDSFFDPDPDAVGKTYTRWGSFLDNVSHFDADLFGVSPREAVNLDPQHRILLEVAWEAFERAGIAPSSMMGSATAAYIGITTLDYAYCASDAFGVINGDAYSASGSSHSMAAGRIAYVFDLRGPNVAVDTACSSSNVALHLAVQALRTRETGLALAGGVNLTLHPLGSILTSRARMMSFTGRCKAFDASADGYVRGEGCGVLVLKRLSDAQRDGDAILAVIRGTALTQDGRSSGITAPNGRAQEAVLRAALKNAGLRPGDISYVEAHGTGTPLGDPIEMKALAEVFGGRPSSSPLMVGSVKTNIGHTEAAAGVAGIIKTVLALQHGTIPPHLHLRNPNPLIPWDRLAVHLPTTATAWNVANGAPRRAGVSSFGFSGTNAHVILEEVAIPSRDAIAGPTAAQPFVLSAQTPEALSELATRFSSHLRRPDAAPLPQMAHAVAAARSQLRERLAFVALDNAEAADKLAAFAAGDKAGVACGRAASGASPEIAFLFTGQGAQYAGMGRELYDTDPVFRATMDQCATLVSPHLTRPLLDVIWGKGDNAGIIDDTAFTQPALFAIEYSLAQLWRSWGVEPTAAVGHSVGEYVAATLAGVFSLEDGLKLLAARARLMSALPRDGAMVAIFTDQETVRSALEGLESKISIAAANGPANVVISGAVGGVEAALSRLTTRGIEFQRLNVSHAFHSPLMEPMLDEFEKIAANVTFNAPLFGLMSNLTGKQAGEEIRQPSYWRRHVREAVRFGDSIGQLLKDGYRLFLEVGPASTLIGMARRCPGSDGATWVGSLRRGRSDRASMLEGLGQLYVQGLSVAWPTVFGGVSAARPANLPTYPFQRRQYWVERRVGPQGSRLNNTRFGHSLLGGAVNSPLHIFESEIGTGTHPWLRDHRFFEFTPFPATGLLELMLAAIREVQGSAAGMLRDVTIREGLFLAENGTVTVQVIVTPTGGGNHAVQVFSRVGESKGGEEAPLWRDHVSATHVAVDEARSAVRAAPTLSDPEPFPVDAYYTKLTKLGVTYGPTFQGLRAVDCGLLEAIGDVALPEALAQDASAYLVHPALLDAALQIIGMLIPGARDLEAGGDLYMPVRVEHYSVRVPGARAARCHVQLDKFEKRARELRADIILFDEGGEVVAELIGLSYFLITRAALANAIKASSAALAREEWLFELAWHASAPDQQSSHDVAGQWILLADTSDVAAQLAARLESRGASVRLVYQGATTERGRDRWIVNSGNAAEVAHVISAATQETSRPLSGLVSLWPLDSSASQSILEIERSQRRLIEGVLNVVRPLSALPARLWIVTRGAQPVGDCVPDLVQSPLLGLGNVIGTEAPELRCVRIDLDPVLRPSEPDLLFDTVWHADTEDRIAFRDGSRQVARLVPGALSAPSDEPRVLEITARGQLDNVQNRAASRRKPGRGEVELRVHATGLNFRDVLNALGMYPGDPGSLGNECAGVVTAVGDGVEHLNVGDEVISMVDRSFATYVTASATLTLRKPPQMSFVEAATIPVAFLTAAYALRNLGRIQKGDRVLIHAATGGVGMAAIQIAKLAGAEIIGTAGSPAKRELAKALGVHHVADSRSLSFESEVQRVTGGEGVDIVLNSLAGDFIPAGLRVLRAGGRFIEIGKTGIWEAAEVARRFPNVEYYALYLGEIAAAQPDLVRGMLEAMVPQFVANELQPLPQRVYPIDRAQDAFRFMAQGHHTGKLVITQRPPIAVSGSATYLITGGLGGIGLASARWLVEAGARHIVLLARRDPSEAARAEISELEMLGAEILVAPVDVADADKLGKLLDRVSRTMPPLRGILHAAGSIDDGTLADQTWSRFERVMAPKARGAWNLHTMTRSSPLDFFVMFSSGAAVLGAPGQSNYAAANTFMDSLAYMRHANGRPAVSINWGGWSEVGMAAEVGEQFHRRWADSGLKMIEPQFGVQMLQQIVLQGTAVQAVAMPIVRSRLPSHSGPLFAELVSANDGGAPVVDSSSAGEEVLARLAPLSGDELLSALIGFLSRQLIRVLALSASYKVDTRRSLLDMGIDSLMATELRHLLQTTLKVAVALPEVLDVTVEQLAATLAARIAGDEAMDGPGAPVTEAVHWEEGTI